MLSDNVVGRAILLKGWWWDMSRRGRWLVVQTCESPKKSVCLDSTLGGWKSTLNKTCGLTHICGGQRYSARHDFKKEKIKLKSLQRQQCA